MKLDEIPTKINKKSTHSFYIVFQVLKAFLINIYYKYLLQINIYLEDSTTSSYIFYCLTLVFTSSADIIFYNSLELHSHCLKNDFCHKFSIYNGFTQTNHTLNDQNSQNFYFLIQDSEMFTCTAATV